MKLIHVIVLSLLLALNAQAQPTETRPDVWIKAVTESAFAAFRDDPEVQKGNEKRMIAVMEAKAMPHFDFNRITRLAAGRYWLSASAEQKESLVSEFTKLLMRTYYRSLANYKDTSVQLKPLRGGETESDVIVRTVFIRPQNPPLAVDFSVWKTPRGWRIYDIAVEGISALANYRTVFAKEIQVGGMDGLIKSLAAKNRVGTLK